MPFSSTRLRELAPDIWQLIRPRRGLLAAGFVLMAINRVCGLVLPASTKYLLDDVIMKRQAELLGPLVLAVVAATAVQGATSFALTQLLSKAAQRLIAELRRKVQAHVGRLPVAYYDANKTGNLVSRIMNDVEGIRNLIGTGLVEFVGGILTAAIALVVLLRISPLMTAVAAVTIGVFAFALRKAFGVVRPIFNERGKIKAEVTGRLTESLGGVRVVKGYHAEERERAVFSGGVERLLENILRALTTISLMSLGATVLMGVVGAVVMYVGARQILRRRSHHRRLRDVHHVPGVPGGAGVPGGGHRHADIGSARRSGAHARSTARAAGRRGPAAPRCASRASAATWYSTTSRSATRPASRCSKR